MKYALIAIVLFAVGCGQEQWETLACRVVNDAHCAWACSLDPDELQCSPDLCSQCEAGAPMGCFDYCADSSEKTWPRAGRACVLAAQSVEACEPWPGDVCAEPCG